jgi:hypothetical protein
VENIATGDLTTVQDAEKDFEERLASYNAAQTVELHGSLES